MNDMYTMSSNMIIDKVRIDSQGYFSIKTTFLPKKDGLYRIHLSKVGSPPASLIIGGQDENHLFIMAHRHSQFNIKSLGRTATLFDSLEITNSPDNDKLLMINKITELEENREITGTPLKRDLISKAVNEKLRTIADTSENPLVSLYAIYQSSFEANYTAHREFYEQYLQKWENEKSLYFDIFRKQIDLRNPAHSLHYVWIALLFFGIGILTTLYIFPTIKRKHPIHDLSIQERKIFKLLQSGKSNKEISEECNIGISTVKSHVSNIYTKLNIKSRKEAMDINHK
ncbi:helix-turn-helix domain-containing protein [Membranihabitans maritimus]|uniref:helix-turn-helix domain-containing protein n=1 Tax=Membranihabitans maritimus TaxID=2904244 RepID=UPI001F452C19|nr:helix-turn-helix transcriptional regulator [Membranihabitans maritimus]